MLMRTKIKREFFPIFISPKNLNQYLIIPEHFVKNLLMFSLVCDLFYQYHYRFLYRD